MQPDQTPDPASRPGPELPAAELWCAPADTAEPKSAADPDPLALIPAFGQATARLLADPRALLDSQLEAWQEWYALWYSNASQMLGQPAAPVIEAARDDYRFRDAAWQDNPLFAQLQQGYLLAARQLVRAWEGIDGLDPAIAGKVEFFARQFADALAPTNFLLTNPAALRTAVESGGASLAQGLRNLLRDLEPETARLQITMADPQAFKLGVNIATTPGSVVFQNDMLQLLQFAPASDSAFQRPLLIVPPWINKYYILDLQARNSFVKWLVEQGHTVFVVSWVNPDAEHADKSFDDYLRDGILAALDAIEQATGEARCNAIGYCLGGTLLASTLAYLQARGETRIASATLLTTLIDFGQPGELGVFIDEDQVVKLEQQMHSDGFLDGKSMASTFSMLRANDLVWSFVINNYLLGKDPLVFDLLYWNADSTRMPAAMHSFYLRNMYLHNALKDPGGISLCGVPIDVSTITTPAYFLSAEEDHIAPWQSTFAGARLFAGPVRFVLGESGHIAGVINPPKANKYGYRTAPGAASGTALGDPQTWREATQRAAGSWWPDWQAWVSEYTGERVPARKPGGGKLKVLEAAPGAYVKQRI